MHKAWINWNLPQWLHHLENRTTQEIQLGLTRIRAVAEKMNLQLPLCKVISVAGTNGKGSTVAALEMLYSQAGYQVAAYTSPHLIHFNERIRVNLEPIADEELCQAFAVIEEIREQVYLTYFETTTLAALWYFKQKDLDIIILEVGLGGRLDATNIIDADLSIITTIDYDHQEYLGNTLEAIAYEKAGILCQGKPFIYADTHPPASILKIVKDLAVPSYFFNIDFFIHEQSHFWELKGLEKQIKKLPKPKIQLKSAAAACMACLLLPLSRDPAEWINYFYLAMQKIFIPGRLQFHPGLINKLYDVSHNEQSAKLLAKTIKTIENKGQVHAVFSALKDKDILGLVVPLKDCVDLWYPAKLNNKRAASTDFLLSSLKNAEIFVEICYTNPFAAFQAALNQARVGDLIVVYGSFFTVGYILAAQQEVLEQKENL